MNEFWGIVLGAVLATAGGIIASFVTMWIKSIETKKEQKKECYMKLLSFCWDLRHYESSKKVTTYRDMSESITTTQLYASSKIYKLFVDFIVTAQEYINKVESKENADVEMNEMSKKYDKILFQIKKELNISITKSNKNKTAQNDKGTER